MFKQFSIIAIILTTSCNLSKDKKEEQLVNNKKYYEVDLNYKFDTLYSYSNEEIGYGSSRGFINKKFDTIIPVNKYDQCYTDTFTTFALVFDSKLDNSSIVGINRQEQVIFDAYIFDNGPDFYSDGLFRIRRNGKIGFANKQGEIIIEPKYECAFPFENNQSKVSLNCEFVKDEIGHISMVSNEWFYIDKNDNKIISDDNNTKSK
jgi:hypothetical protein